ncbi:MAG: TrbG/VirB9 family P-type conjugative transfer protein [Pseudomonadota bacterium]
MTRRNALQAWRDAAMLVVCLSMSATTLAEALPIRGKVDSRIRTASYSADQVYRLYGFVGYAIELIFEDGEAFTGKGGGDLEGVTIDAHANSVLLKPRAALVATNLVIYTDRRSYRFDYSVEVRRPSRLSDDLIYAVRFLYPPRPDGPSAEEEIERELAKARAERPRNSDYWFCGHRSLRPVAASDDGVHTRLTFADRAEIPAIFVRNEDGTESLLNFSMNDGDVLVHRLAPKLILRRGKLTGCIVNQGFDGSGTRLDSGTVSPNVERESRALRP